MTGHRFHVDGAGLVPPDRLVDVFRGCYHCSAGLDVSADEESSTIEIRCLGCEAGFFVSRQGRIRPRFARPGSTLHGARFFAASFATHTPSKRRSVLTVHPRPATAGELQELAVSWAGRR